jgi:hypothetical protein
MTADDRLNALVSMGATVEGAIEVVNDYLDEAGELPEGLTHHLCMVVADRGEESIDQVVMRARAAWFRRQGKRVPRMPTPKFQWE